MSRPKFRVVSMNEVKITRKNGDTAVFEYDDLCLGGGMNLTIGPERLSMTDFELLEAHNEVVRKMKQMSDSYEHLAIEIPDGNPQIKYSKESNQWTPRGDVLRCYIDDGGEEDEEGNPGIVIEIDDKRLSLKEFGRLLRTYTGWGMRVIFVPDNQLLETPEIIIHEPVNRD